MHAVFVRAARRISGSFAIFFARVWRKICVTSTPDAHFFAFGRTADSMKSFGDVLQFMQRMLADFRQRFCARRAKILGILQLFRATFAEDLRDLEI